MPRPTLLAYGDVYVDDFIPTAPTKHLLDQVMYAQCYTPSTKYCGLSPTAIVLVGKNQSRSQSFLKAMPAGQPRTTILGWHFDTVADTLQLPPHRLDRLYTLIDAFPTSRRRVPIAEWHQLLGELWSTSTALPGSRGLSSTLQDALRKGNRHRICLNRTVFQSLADFRAIADSLRDRPTRFREFFSFRRSGCMLALATPANVAWAACCSHRGSRSMSGTHLSLSQSNTRW